MTVRQIRDLGTPVGDVLRAANAEGVLLEAGEQTTYAVLPLDEDLLDYLLEHSPKLAEACRRARDEMQRGRFLTHEQVKARLGEPPAAR